MIQAEKLSNYEEKLNKTINDAKYWLKKYTDSYTETDKNLAGIKTEISGKISYCIDELQNRASVRDIKINFNILNDLLGVKFK